MGEWYNSQVAWPTAKQLALPLKETQTCVDTARGVLAGSTVPQGHIFVWHECLCRRHKRAEVFKQSPGVLSHWSAVQSAPAPYHWQRGNIFHQIGPTWS
jgi:hypothetical protein